MKHSRASTIFLYLASFVCRIQCLSAIPGSPCYDTCIGDSSTSSNDIVCLDSDWTQSRKGRVLTRCMNCLENSSYQSGPMTDTILFLYYLSSVQQTCLSGAPAAPISRCSSSCGEVDSAFSSIGGRSFFQSPYSYCSANSGVYTETAPDCATCLASQNGAVILSNFVYTGNVACEQQPDLEASGALSFAADLFATTPLASNSNGTTATATATSASNTTTVTLGLVSLTSPTNSNSTNASHSASATASTVVSTSNTSGSPTASAGATSSNSSSVEAKSGSGGLSRGAAAGIGIVLGILGVAAVVVLALVARRRMLAKQTEKGARPWSKMQDTPEVRQAPTTGGLEAGRSAALTAAGVPIPIPPPPPEPPSTAMPKSSKSLKSSISWRNLTPRTSQWFHAANPKQSSDLQALPQRGWD